ncbi:unnamed protein product [Closterium sp. Yama58-4]|nr:unnamed protein product [Closterium sp. Yama58-4]
MREAAVLSVKLPAWLTLAVTCAHDIQARTITPSRPTLGKPLTKLLRQKGRTLLLLPQTAAKASPLASTTPAATTAVACTPTASTTTATTIPTSATTTTTCTPTTTSTLSATAASSTVATTPTTASSSATPTAPAFPAPAIAAPPTRGRRCSHLLSTKVVSSCGRGDERKKGGGRASLKEGCARSATRSTYSDYASLSCKEVLLEQVDSEVCGFFGKKEFSDSVKRAREAGDDEVEGDVHGRRVLGEKLGRKRGSVADGTSTKVSDEVGYCGKGGRFWEQVGQ